MRIILIIGFLIGALNAAGKEVYQFTNILIDRDKNIIHKFMPNIELFLFDNGEVLSQHDEYTYYYDLFNNVKWKKKIDIHHHAFLDIENNEIWTITYDIRIHKNRRVAFDSIVILDSKNGEVKKKYDLYSLLEQLKNKNKKLELLGQTPPQFDLDDRLKGKAEHVYLNTNYLEILKKDYKHPAFKKGNILLSFNFTSEIVVLDREFKKVLWSYSGDEILHQHTPVLLDDGKMLIYDNGDGEKRKFTRIITLDPMDNKVELLFPKKKKDSFFARLLGGAFLTKRGTIIFNNPAVVTNNIIEINFKGDVIWRFENSSTSGSDGYRANVINIDPDLHKKIKLQYETTSSP